MPLSLTKALSTGISAGYFRLARLNCDALNGRATAIVNLYLDKAAFQSGKQPIDQFPFEIALDIAGNASLMTTIETLLKSQPFLIGAQDA